MLQVGSVDILMDAAEPALGERTGRRKKNRLVDPNPGVRSGLLFLRICRSVFTVAGIHKSINLHSQLNFPRKV